MKYFELIESGYSSLDETINFGARPVQTENLYEISTTATFKSKDSLFNGVEDIAINSFIKNGLFFIALDKELRIFKNEELFEPIFNIEFNSKIQNMVTSFNENLLLLELETELTLIQIDQEKGSAVIYSEQCTNVENIFAEQYFEIEDCVARYLVLFHNGLISRISVSKVAETYKVETNNIYNLNFQVSSTTFSYPLLFTNGSVSNIFNIETYVNIFTKTFDVKKVVELGSKFLGLDFGGRLRKICQLTLKAFVVQYNFLIEDILLLDSSSETEILTVTKPNETGEIFLQLLKVDFTCIVSLQIGFPVYLVKTLDTDSGIFILSKVQRDGKITELRLQSLYEADPESRIHRLIRKGKLEEAELFAQKFDVDSIIIQKAKAQILVDRLNPLSSKEVDSLISLMDSINDKYFNLECCKNVSCSLMGDVRKILEYASRIQPIIGTDERVTYLELQKLLSRLNVFSALSDSSNTIDQWIRFSCCDLLEEVKYCLRFDKIHDAIFILSKLDQQECKRVDDKYIQELLTIIEEKSKKSYHQYVQIFFLFDVTNYSCIMNLFFEWLEEKILYMNNKQAIEMIETTLNFLKMVNNDNIGSYRFTLANKIKLYHKMLTGFLILETLKNDYGININISEYLKGPIPFVTTLLQFKPQSFDNFLKNFMLPFMSQHDLKHDKLLSEVIKKCSTFNQNLIAHIEVLLNHIKSINLRLDTIYSILLTGPMPWCSITRSMATAVLHLSHPKVKDIEFILKNEDRLRVLKKTEYLIQENLIDCVSPPQIALDRVIRRFIYLNQPEMIDDIFYLCTNYAEFYNAGYILISTSIAKGHNPDFDKVFSILEKKDKNLVFDCAFILFEEATRYITQKNSNKVRKNCYYQSFNKLKNLLTNSTNCDTKKNNIENKFRIAKGIFWLNEHFEHNFTFSDFYSHRKDENIKNVIRFIVEPMKLDSADLTELLIVAGRIAYYFSLDKYEVLELLCTEIKRYDIILAVGELLYNQKGKSKNLNSIATLILKYFGSQDDALDNEQTFFGNIGDVSFIDTTKNSELHRKGLQLATKLSAKSLVHHGDVNAVPMFIYSCCDLATEITDVQNILYKDIYSVKTAFPKSLILNKINQFFQTFPEVLDSNFSPVETVQNSELFNIEVSKFKTALNMFFGNCHHLTAFCLLDSLLNSQTLICNSSEKNLELLRYVIISTWCPQTIDAVISSKHIDEELLFNLFLMIGGSFKKIITKYMQINNSNTKKLSSLCKVGIRLCKIFDDKAISRIRKLEDTIKTCKWWEKLTVNQQENIIIEQFFRQSADLRLKHLISLDILTLPDVTVYCEEYNLSSQKYYTDYLKSYLLNWKLKCNTETDLDVDHVRENENILLTKCTEIINVIGNKQEIFKELENLLEQINFYHYEVFHIIYKLLENNFEGYCKKYKHILLFLKTYTRYNPPCQREEEAWLLKFPHIPVLDPLSKYRLPFTDLLFTDIWAVLRYELSLKSYKIWFSVKDMFKLNVDKLCSYAVENVGHSGTFANFSTESWIFKSIFNNLIEEVVECIENISTLEITTSTMYEFMNCMPNGTDKIRAAKITLHYATLYSNEYPDDERVQDALIKVRNKFYGLSVAQVLHKFNLSDEKYMKLVIDPNNLMKSLYMDERILIGNESSTFDNLGIHQAVESIANIFDLNVQDIRLNLLKEFLNISIVNLDTTLNFPIFKNSYQNKNVVANNLKRAIYLCSGSDRDHWLSYLFKFGFNESCLQYKLNVLRCFCGIANEDEILHFSEGTMKEFLFYLDRLAVLNDLETLGIQLTEEEFEKSDKKKLLKALAKMALEGRSLAVKCMGSLCILNFLENDEYWTFIIKWSIKQEMISEFESYVNFLKTNKSDKQFFLTAWQTIIDKSFEKIHTSDENLDNILLKNLFTMQRCPVFFHLSFDKVIHCCIQLKKMEYAAVLLKYLSEEKRRSFSKDVFTEKFDYSKFEELEKKGF